MGYENVPKELRDLVQWLTWKYEPGDNPDKPTKVPYQPLNGWRCDVTNPSQWTTFENALNAVNLGAYNGIGLALAVPQLGGKHTVIDLDHSTDPDVIARQKLISDQFDSYSEISPSGLGLHVIVEGTIPTGRKRGAIEMYSDRRFITFTGNVFNAKPIARRQELLDILYNEMSLSQGKAVNFDGEPERETDNEILLQGGSAPVNGERFRMLYEGHWQQAGYPSQSEADFAFIDMLANYSKNKEQVKRIFLNSWLGMREKAQKRPAYVQGMVDRAYDRTLSPIDLSGFDRNKFKNAAPAQIGGISTGYGPIGAGAASHTSAEREESQSGDEIDTPKPNGVKRPPGLMGDIADYIYWQSHRPVQEIALCAAISLMAGICGRQFNTPTGAGLNLYTVLIAQTAVGKEAMAAGINKLMSYVKRQVNEIDTFMGPAEIASGPAFLRRLETHVCCFSILTEFGHFLQNICAANAPPHLVTLRKVLLDAYTKSGRGNAIQASVYSDKEKNINPIHEPAFSILAESTPSTFYTNLDESLISMGLLARLMIIEYHGDRVEANKNLQPVPSENLVSRLGGLAAYCMTNQKGNIVIQVQYNNDSQALADKFDRYCDDKVRQSGDGPIRDLYGRAHLTVMKLASLLAVSENSYHPVISADNWNFAQELLERAVSNMVKRFEKGDVGKVSLEPMQLKLIHDQTAKYIDDILLPKKLSPGYGVTQKMLDDGVIPFAYYNSKLARLTTFNSGFGDKGAALVRRVLKVACDLGLIAEIKEGRRFAYGSEKLMYQIRELPK